MKFSISEIIEIIQAKADGDLGFEIRGLASFDDAGPYDLTFACDLRYLSRLEQTGAGAVLVPESFPSDNKVAANCILLRTPNPKLSFFELVKFFYPGKPLVPHIHKSAVIGNNSLPGQGIRIEANVVIGDNVTLGNYVHIMANTYIADDCFLGDHTIIKPNVTLMEGSDLGHHVIVHSGSVIGSDGYGFTQTGGTHEKLVHTGHVKIGNHVEIGACNTIDRGTLGVTSIGNGVKTDNLVHIAHNVKIGDNTLVVAQVGIAGSTCIGKNVILAGKAGISGHLTIGDSVIVGPSAGVTSDVPENQIVSGLPHMPHKTWLKVVNIISRLPEMRKKIFSFEKRLKDLETKSEKME
ncbi:MAG: UDP-3-O-(3-hydroxymyristoyl)glucosamine N-acyltransferase [Proteobacteria bacterium]|nr:UDP-3-O-(3-hydroxymyristoyl)glucosamine N-acyltransferase [Desulfobacula sp.]MBU3952413.1 UDP-3-O-(3-hydroxymyristoyl)glucosamine N-acyltransferase [Pseudomonadota bacterium]MBU4131839.1 UDP-3-O-(3-hydroxymyristoyl)glucosamine N-acyltransferase [Pseudomonadota bacterium]